MIRVRCARLVPIACLALASAGCDRGLVRERQSAADVARAEESVRSADNVAKRRALGLLSAPCFGEQPCAVQRVCHAAYTLHIDGLELTQAAKQRLANDEPNEAAKLLGSAAQKLEQARHRVVDCTERAAGLRRQYKL